jgi:HTH-type transcriptional regulator/antitoxin HigA
MMCISEELIHPGKILSDLLDAEQMSQKELAIRTGVTEKHISTIITGKKDISGSFAKKLEYALPRPMKYWIDLQADYDSKLIEYEELHGIDDDEIGILSSLKEVIPFLQEQNVFSQNLSKPETVMELRKFMGVTNLKVIPDITYSGAYRAQVKNNVGIDEYVLYAWKRICEGYTRKVKCEQNLNLELLQTRIPVIKSLMFKRLADIETLLTDILAECGIAFAIVPHFKGAPVQGFINTLEDKRLMLCLTLRQKRADKFWFTLFHELGHIVNGDAEIRFVDFDSVKSEQEEMADIFAGNALINPDDFKGFLKTGDFSLNAISQFAKRQGVKNYIVIGRLQIMGELEWTDYPKEFVYYDWA